jgi:hypothetical protein
MPCCYEKAVAKGFGLRNKLFFLISNFFFSPFLSKMAAFLNYGADKRTGGFNRPFLTKDEAYFIQRVCNIKVIS